MAIRIYFVVKKTGQESLSPSPFVGGWRVGTGAKAQHRLRTPLTFENGAEVRNRIVCLRHSTYFIRREVGHAEKLVSSDASTPLSGYGNNSE